MTNQYQKIIKTRPVVYIHNGWNFYLKPVLKQALRTCTRVVLLGDESNVHLCPEHYYSIDFKSNLEEEFSRKYINMSWNPYSFEYACYTRYFRLLEFMERFQLEDAVMVDSDLMIYTDLSTYNFMGDVASHIPTDGNQNYRWSVCPCVYYTTRFALHQFVEYLFTSYEANILKLQEKWLFHTKKCVGGGVCDMTQLWLFLNQCTLEVQTLEEKITLEEGGRCMFDSGIHVAQECLMTKSMGIKKLIFSFGKPYFCDDMGKIEALTIHLNGNTKYFIDSIKRQRTNYVEMKVYYCFRKVQKGIKKICKKTLRRIIF